MAASETNQRFSSSSNEMRRFIFNRLQKMDNQRALYTLRLIQKSEQKVVDKKIQTAKIGFPQIKQFATSNFRVQFLHVSMRVWQDSFDDLEYLSTTYLPSAQNIHVKIYPSVNDYPSFSSNQYVNKKIKLKIHEPLIFQRLHLQNQSKVDIAFHISGNYNVEIWDCEFIGISVSCVDSASIFVTGSKFQNCPFGGLQISKCASVYIDNIIVENSVFDGLIVENVKEDVNINNVRVVNCARGIFLANNATNFKLSDTTIRDCGEGIHVWGLEGAEIQRANIEGCEDVGIQIGGAVIVRYAFVEFNHNRENIRIYDDESQFLPLQVIR